MPFFTVPRVLGLDDQTQETFAALVKQWQAKYPRNLERMLYLDGKNKLKDLQVSIPPELVDKLDVVMGWPEKAVFEMANRIVFEGAVFPGGDGERDPFDLRRTLHENRFQLEFPQSVVSSLSFSTSFASTTRGDVSDGDPSELLMFHSALWSTGIWDRRRRRLSSGLVVNDTDANGSPTRFTLLLPAETLVCAKGPRAWVLVDRYRNTLGRVPMEALPFRPALDRPFGRSRIDRRVISLTDRALRAGARLDVHSELFSAMKLILLGVGEDAFTDQNGNKVPLWSFYMGRMGTLGKDEDGDLPKLEKITAESPEPHIAVMRQLSSEFSGHTGVPMSSLGIATDNVESADAKSMAREDIVSDAERQHTVYGFALHRLFENLVMLREGLSEPPADMLDMTMKWRRPDRPTLTALAAAGAQQVGTIPWLAETEVGLELLGLDRQAISRALSEKRRTQGRNVLEAIRAGAAQAPPTEPDEVTDEVADDVAGD